MTCISKTVRLLQILLFVLPMQISAQMYTAKGIRTTLFSTAPLEDIRAVSVKGTAVFNSQTRELLAQLPIRSFEFDRKLMQEHFNENYMDSDRHPYATFKGLMDSTIDFNKDGEYNILLDGKLTVHGVERQRSIPAQLTIKSGKIHLSTRFLVNCTDHSIKIPTLMFTKIAESIRITAEGQLQPLNP